MKPTDTPDLAEAVSSLNRELARLNSSRYMRAHRTLGGMIGYSVVRGLAVGLGTVMGATILVSVAAYFLTQIDFIPIIGDWAKSIAQEMEQGRSSAN
ncbi:hypothetical protein ACMU_03120 [Actibacterium mucosum KCTC 23349]|uniref:Uncharacterized protein n=1 Tax=Actibacterium mucosum KCTC 23349 TaxID=1454373 RepID=A0A037ZRN3_9RHOB|nr:DUF5665 domain-containing protein [Actibacterium mucosum]KAJ57512.1 hypothetical protein ACMU_03120 [Actibacterium mucosum KCTC 23349]